MFHAIYVYGHLVGIACSLLIAVLFLIVARRLRSVVDVGNALTFLATAVAAVIEMAQAIAPTEAGAIGKLISFATIYVGGTIGFHAQYGFALLAPWRARRQRLALAVYVGYVAALIALLATGSLTEGIHHVELLGARSAVATGDARTFVLLLGIPVGSLVLCAPLLLTDGPRWRERRNVFLPMVIAPIVTLWDVAMVPGWGPERIPLAGFFSGLLGVSGLLLLLSRLHRADDLLAMPRLLRDYELGERLGVGGMAEVFVGRHRASEALGVPRLVAIKRLRADRLPDRRTAVQFLDEARIAARLRHPNVVGLLDVGEQDGTHFLVMDLIDGVTLATLMYADDADGEAPELPPTAVVVEIALQVADALAYAHQATGADGHRLDLVHRDVSPQNILIDRTGQVRLGDFGIARAASREFETTGGGIQGKLRYIAPERLHGEAYDHRVDLYSLAAILFELTTGELPIQAPSDAALVYEILKGRIRLELLHDVPGPLAFAISRGLTLEPSQRFASAEALRQILGPMRDEAAARAWLAAQVERAAPEPIRWRARAGAASPEPRSAYGDARNGLLTPPLPTS